MHKTSLKFFAAALINDIPPISIFSIIFSSLSPDKYYSAFHDSHPSAVLRIERLQ